MSGYLSGNFCALINIYFSFSVLCENPMLRYHRLAILPPSGSYDPEFLSTTRQMIVYLAFWPSFPLCSHALCTSVTHSLHLYNNFFLLYLLIRPSLGPALVYISLVRIDVRSPRHLSTFPISHSGQSSSMLRAAICLGVAGGALTFLLMRGISGSFWALLTYYDHSPRRVVMSDIFVDIRYFYVFYWYSCSSAHLLLELDAPIVFSGRARCSTPCLCVA